MKPYLISLGIGLLVGALYSLLGARSPAPPAIALLGLLGMLLGEQAVPVIRHAWHGGEVIPFWVRTCAPRVTGIAAPVDPPTDHP